MSDQELSPEVYNNSPPESEPVQEDMIFVPSLGAHMTRAELDILRNSLDTRVLTQEEWNRLVRNANLGEQ